MAPPEYEIFGAANFAELQTLPGIRLISEPAQDFFCTLEWFQNLELNGIEADSKILFLVAQETKSREAFCLPLLRRPFGKAALFGPVLCSLSNFYCSLYGPIGDDRLLTVAALRAVVRHLRSNYPMAAVLDFQPLDTESRFYRTINSALRAEGYITDAYFCFGNWHSPVDGRSFSEYEPTIPSRLRNTIKRGRKKLDAAGPWEFKIHCELGPELECAISDFNRIYAKSWKEPEPFPEFVPGLCRTAAKLGWLRLGVIQHQGHAIAAQLWLVKDLRAMIYKLAYDEEHKQFSAGSVLSAEMMRHALDLDRVVDVDYLTGDDGYSH